MKLNLNKLNVNDEIDIEKLIKKTQKPTRVNLSELNVSHMRG